jgi:hypothetical protein
MRRRKATVELFEEIRREHEFGIGMIQGVATAAYRWTELDEARSKLRRP